MLYNNYTQQEYKSSHVIIPATENAGALILGDLNAATDPLVINQHNIKTIITAASGLEHLKIPSEMTHVVFPLMDTKQENIATYFQLSYHTIEENLKRGSVLVHCGAGISRSASLIIAYYMKKYHASFKNAITHVKKIKPNVFPNLGFELQLKDYQNSLAIQHQDKKNQTIKTSKSIQKSPVPYLFEPPIKASNKIGFRNGFKNINHFFNKTQAEKIYQKAKNVGNDLFIEGINSKSRQIEINQAYEPKKYSRKKGQIGRNSISMAKKQIGSIGDKL